MEPFGALPSNVVDANPLKNMVGPCGLEPQTSTVSIAHRFYNNLEDRGDCQSTRKSYKTSHSVAWGVGWKKSRHRFLSTLLYDKKLFVCSICANHIKASWRNRAVKNERSNCPNTRA